MLPEKLSNQVCSLRPGEDKLCYSAVFEMSAQANVLKEWFGRTVIHSQHRFTYEAAQEVIEKGRGPLAEEVGRLHQMAVILRKQRFDKGAISFEKEEVKFRLDEKGNPLGVFLKEYKDSNKLIEEFMLLANRQVAEFIGRKSAGRKNTPPPVFVYRIHDSPPSDKLEDFARMADRFGYKINTSSEKDIAHSLNKLLAEVKGRPEQHMLEQLAIRSMSKAKYTTENIGHYGLAFEYYTHFTSPIRRYPDVLVHRLLERYMHGGKTALQKELEKKCLHSTAMEIQASDAERTSVKYKQVQYLSGRVGESFEGVISGVTEWGLYVELTESKCEGLIRLRDLEGDYYELDEKNYCIRGMRNRKTFTLGDRVRVMLKRTNLEKKQIDFMMEADGGSVAARRDGKGGRPPARKHKAERDKSGKPKAKTKGKEKAKGKARNKKRR
jgi:ribonuclease R